MPHPDPQRVSQLRAVIADFLNKRLDDKLQKIKDDSEDAHAHRSELGQQFSPAAWLQDAARRAAQIRAATHCIKQMHPDAKGTTLYCPPPAMTVLPVVGSHCLGEDFDTDMVGSASVLDVCKFLMLEHQGSTLLALALAGDKDLAAALTDEPAKAQQWLGAFAALIEPRGPLASHPLAKQLYWPTGDDPHDDASYHVIAPLYASSLAHRVYETVQDDRFSQEAKAARKARNEGVFSQRPVREYPDLAVQQMGGTKPNNLGHLNTQRRGSNFLLASLPPAWRAPKTEPLLGTDSVFPLYSRRPEVRQSIRALRAFLKDDPAPNIHTRQRRAAWVSILIDEFVQLRAELLALAPGWSQRPECRLDGATRHWLDPDGVGQACDASGEPLPLDSHKRICEAFAHWLNAQLQDPLPMDEPEFLAWRKEMAEQIKAEQLHGAMN